MTSISLFTFYYTFSFLGNSSLLNNIYPRSSLTTCDFAPAFIQPTCLLSISFMPVPGPEARVQLCHDDGLTSSRLAVGEPRT